MAKSKRTPSDATDRTPRTLKELGAQAEQGMSESRDNVRNAAEDAQKAAQAAGEEMQAAVSRAGDEARREGIDAMQAAGKAMQAPLDRSGEARQQGREGERESGAAEATDRKSA